MLRKFFYLVKISFNKKLKSKWFIAVNVILAIAMFALFNLNSIITFFGGDLDDEILITLNIDDKLLSASVTSEKKIDQDIYQLIYQSLNSTKQQVLVEKLNLDSNTLAMLSNSIDINRIVLSDKKTQDENMSMIMSTVFPSLILPFFMLIVFLVQMVGGEICEEKTTKSMEIIISNVSPKTHLLSKIVANNLFVLLQGILFFLYGLVSYFISSRNGSLNIPSEITNIWDGLVATGLLKNIISFIPFLLVLSLLSFLAYSLLAGILASMTTNIEDFQQLQAPIVFILLAGYYLSIMAGMFQGSAFLKAASYIPLISCLLSPTLFVMGEVTMVDVTISIVLLIVFLYLIVNYGMKVYKVGILNYSNEKVWTRFVKAFRKED